MPATVRTSASTVKPVTAEAPKAPTPALALTMMGTLKNQLSPAERKKLNACQAAVAQAIAAAALQLVKHTPGLGAREAVALCTAVAFHESKFNPSAVYGYDELAAGKRDRGLAQMFGPSLMEAQLGAPAYGLSLSADPFDAKNNLLAFVVYALGGAQRHGGAPGQWGSRQPTLETALAYHVNGPTALAQPKLPTAYAQNWAQYQNTMKSLMNQLAGPGSWDRVKALAVR